jgi:hypothetical protein
MLCELVALRGSDSYQGTFERCVAELVDPAAFVADKVVMVLASRKRRFEACGAGAKIDAMHKTEVGELLEHPVDARDPDVPSFRA